MYCILSQLVPAAIVEYHKQGSLNNRNYFLTVLEPGKSEIRVPTWSDFGENSIPDLQMNVFLMSSHG